jgi:eukaryotic-like serine/threonine-protein kinase
MAAWIATATTGEEARAHLQARLIVLSRIMFWSFAVLLLVLVAGYAIYPEVEPKWNRLVYVIAAGGLAQLAVIWRVFLVRGTRTMKQLRAIDVYYAVGTGSIFAASGALAFDLRSSAYLCLIYACFLVLLRASVVPSTGKRTAVIGVFTVLPMTVATVALVYLNTQDVPGPMYVGGGMLICTLAILLATIESSVLYGLTQKFNAAMQLGQYTLAGKLGEGGNGVVYRANHALLRRPTAIKVLMPEKIDRDTLDRFEREVQLMSQLTHPNTVAVFDYGRSPEGFFYYVMEYLDGIDLENLVTLFGPQPADRVVPILIQVCGALAEAHGRGLIHRDVKPANIILSERGGVPDIAKVLDFGLVKELATDGGVSTRGVMGTPAYISPETVTDPDRVGPQSDLYALGAVGYYLLTGKRLFDGKTTVDVCVQHVTAEPARVSSHVAVPEALDAIIFACLAKNPADRPASARDLAKRLQEVPIADAWSEAIAVQWWVEFRATGGVPREVVAKTITIDLELRSRSA